MKINGKMQCAMSERVPATLQSGSSGFSAKLRSTLSSPDLSSSFTSSSLCKVLVCLIYHQLSYLNSAFCISLFPFIVDVAALIVKAFCYASIPVIAGFLMVI